MQAEHCTLKELREIIKQALIEANNECIETQDEKHLKYLKEKVRIAQNELAAFQIKYCGKQ